VHEFVDLLERGTLFTLGCLENHQTSALEQLQSGARTSDVKSLQMVNLQKAVIAVGVFAIVEAHLQDRGSGEGGFKIVAERLDKEGLSELRQRLLDLRAAVNVLKHGEGASYKRLLDRGDAIRFKIKQPEQSFFHESDVSEAATLVKVNDAFIRETFTVIREVVACVEHSVR